MSSLPILPYNQKPMTETKMSVHGGGGGDNINTAAAERVGTL